jgi:hypothetical protein
MAIYRGAGGAGDATADSSSEALLVRTLAAQATIDAASAAASATSASASATSAAASAATIDTTAFARKANNLSDLTSASTARTNLGLVIGTDVLSPSGSGASLTSLNATNLSSGTVAAARLPAFTGDATSSAGTSALTLATVNSNTGAFGSTTSIPVITVNGKGLITAVSTATVSSLPSQTGNSGKYLTTDGSSASWGTIGGGQYFGSAATKAIAYNSNTISENVTVTAGNNGLSAGPITISSTYTVTVETGAVWVIV